MSRPEPALLDELERELGQAAILTGTDAAEFGERRRSRNPDEVVVIRPATTLEVATAIERCAAYGVAIVAQGGDTGLSYGTDLPTDRAAVVLSLSRLNKIESVDRDRWSITAQAGVTIEALQNAADSVGRQFAPDWATRGTATIGGAIATDAGGNNVVRYGNLRDHVLGMEVVLADGRVWDGRRALRKDSSGYDLKQLFIGAEGTLGIVTSAVVKLVPAQTSVRSALAAISGLDDLLPLLELAQQNAAGALTAFELIPEVGLHNACRLTKLPRPLPPTSTYYVLVKFGASASVTDALSDFLTAATERGHVIDAVVAATPEQESNLWRLRDELSPTRLYPDYHRLGVKLDTAVPLDRISEFIERVHELAATVAPMAHCYGFGHVGDGNIHMMVLPTSPDTVESFANVRDQVEASIDELVFELGGTLSAEHGVGLLLRDRIRRQKPSIEWELMRSVKAALDPDDRFNPGKLLPGSEPR